MDFITPATLAALMLGATHYVDIGGPQDAVIFYETAVTAHMRLPDGTTFTGDWELTEDGYFVAWQNGPEGSWRLAQAPGRIGYINGEGQDFGPITRIEYGNPEKLPDQ